MRACGKGGAPAKGCAGCGAVMRRGAHHTMFTCCSSFSSEISRMAVGGMPSSSCSSRIFLSAIVSPLILCRALYTTPYVPSPGRCVSRSGGAAACATFHASPRSRNRRARHTRRRGARATTRRAAHRSVEPRRRRRRRRGCSRCAQRVVAVARRGAATVTQRAGRTNLLYLHIRVVQVCHSEESLHRGGRRAATRGPPSASSVQLGGGSSNVRAGEQAIQRTGAQVVQGGAVKFFFLVEQNKSEQRHNKRKRCGGVGLRA